MREKRWEFEHGKDSQTAYTYECWWSAICKVPQSGHPRSALLAKRFLLGLRFNLKQIRYTVNSDHLLRFGLNSLFLTVCFYGASQSDIPIGCNNLYILSVHGE